MTLFYTLCSSCFVDQKRKTALRLLLLLLLLCVWCVVCMGTGRVMCIWRDRRLTPGVFINRSPFYFLRQSLSYWTWNLLIQYTDWPTSPGILLSPPSHTPPLTPSPSTVPGFQACTTTLNFFFLFWSSGILSSGCHTYVKSSLAEPFPRVCIYESTRVLPPFYLQSPPVPPPGEGFPKPWEDSLVAWNIQPLAICSYL